MGDWHDPSLGRYLRHECVAGPVVHRELGSERTGGLLRYVYFPVENTLTVYFDRGECRYVNLNASRSSVDSVNRMSQHELFGARYTESFQFPEPPPKLLADGFVFADEGSLAVELLVPTAMAVWHPDMPNPHRPSRPAKYFLSSLSLAPGVTWEMVRDRD
jgi:hypothetical protein